MKKIKLSNTRYYAIVDDDDYENLKNLKWHLSGYIYARNSKLGQMHRLIMNCPEDKEIHHMNNKPLDNRKQNLKICTHKENMNNLKYHNK